MTLYQIDAPHFCAGAVTEQGVIVRAASIIKYMRGWTAVRMMEYCAQKKWKCARVEDHVPQLPLKSSRKGAL